MMFILSQDCRVICDVMQVECTPNTYPLQLLSEKNTADTNTDNRLEIPNPWWCYKNCFRLLFIDTYITSILVKTRTRFLVSRSRRVQFRHCHELYRKGSKGLGPLSVSNNQTFSKTVDGSISFKV